MTIKRETVLGDFNVKFPGEKSIWKTFIFQNFEQAGSRQGR